MTLDPIPVREGRIEDYCTIAEAAQLKGIANSSLYSALHAGRLQTYQVLGETVLLRSEVEAWKVRAKNGSRSQH